MQLANSKTFLILMELYLSYMETFFKTYFSPWQTSPLKEMSPCHFNKSQILICIVEAEVDVSIQKLPDASKTDEAAVHSEPKSTPARSGKKNSKRRAKGEAAEMEQAQMEPKKFNKKGDYMISFYLQFFVHSLFWG